MLRRQYESVVVQLPGLPMRTRFLELIVSLLFLNAFAMPCPASAPPTTLAARPLDWVRVSPDHTHFILASTGQRIVMWGFNYDRDDAGRLLEDYWANEWNTVAEDFREMKS